MVDWDAAEQDWNQAVADYRRPSALERALLAGGAGAGALLGDMGAREGASFLSKAIPLAKRAKGAGLGALAGLGVAHLANAVATPSGRERTVHNHRVIRGYKGRNPETAYGTIARLADGYQPQATEATGGGMFSSMADELGVPPDELQHLWQAYRGDLVDIAEDLGVDAMDLHAIHRRALRRSR